MARESFLHGLDESQKAKLFEDYITGLERINEKSGVIYGSIQIIENLEQNAIISGMHSCPFCGRK